MATVFSNLTNPPAAACTGSRQSPNRVCRNSRIVEYHGESIRPSNHRQSGTNGSNTHVGFPGAPARCATPVSIVITRSGAETAPPYRRNLQFLRPIQNLIPAGGDFPSPRPPLLQT